MKRTTLLLLSLLLALPVLHGCIPLIAAGGGAAVMVGTDRRTNGTILDDNNIESKIASRIKDNYGAQVHVDVISYNRFVLLVGQVPNEDTKDAIGVIALGTEGVRNVQNELAIEINASGSVQANDAYLTSKVKANFVGDKEIQTNAIKVVTENGTVYLMGLVKHKEAENAAQVAATAGGVMKVVKVFEYLD